MPSSQPSGGAHWAGSLLCSQQRIQLGRPTLVCGDRPRRVNKLVGGESLSYHHRVVGLGPLPAGKRPYTRSQQAQTRYKLAEDHPGQAREGVRAFVQREGSGVGPSGLTEGRKPLCSDSYSQFKNTHIRGTIEHTRIGLTGVL